MKKISNSNRRSFLTGSAAIAGVAAISSFTNLNINIAKADHSSATPKATPEYIKWKNRNALIIHTEGTVETHRDMIGNGIITPIENMYIRNNVNSLNDQQIGVRSEWKLDVQGVQKPRTFTLAELQKMPLRITPMVLQCSGNGRKFFAHGPSGTKWDTGSAACVTFSGVSVKYLAELCGGLTPSVKFITGTGADAPKDIDPKEGAVERSVPISTYEDLEPMIEETRKGYQNIFWNTPIKWFAKSSGTTNAKSNMKVDYDDSLVKEFEMEIERIKNETAKSEASRLQMEDEIVCLKANLELAIGKAIRVERENKELAAVQSSSSGLGLDCINQIS